MHAEHGRLMQTVLDWHERGLGWSLSRPLVLHWLCVLLVGGTWLSYKRSGLRPAAGDG